MDVNKTTGSVDSNKSVNRKSRVTYFTQVILIYIIVLSCIINLSLLHGNEALWSSLLSGALGYMLPAPGSTRRSRNRHSTDAAIDSNGVNYTADNILLPTPPIAYTDDQLDGLRAGSILPASTEQQQ